MIPPKVLDKLEKRVRKLGGWRYAVVSEVPLEKAETMDHFRAPPSDLDYEAAPAGTLFGAHWGTAWFHGHVEIPRSCKGRRVYYRHVSCAEKLLFVDGSPFAGMDRFHQEVLLQASPRGGEEFDLHVEAYSGHPFPGMDGHSPESRTLHAVGDGVTTAPPLPLEASELVVERETVSALFYEADVLLQTARTLDKNDRRRAAILDQLNMAIDLIPMEWAEEETLEEGARAARKLLAPLLKQRNAPSAPAVGVVGHAHIDVAWLWPLRESIRKAARTFSSMLNLMDDYGEFRFIQSQPVLCAMIEEHYPDLLARIKKRVREGRWEPNGGMWVEADCNVSGGEALVRQFLEGRKKTQELFGYTSDTLWLPDVFGYSAALPQILRGCGIDHFVTSKINWNDTNRFPYDTFWWRGIDGTEIFTHFITARTHGYNADVSPLSAKEAWDHVQQKECQDATIMSVGHGDGGGGTTREMIERGARMKDIEGCLKTDFVNVSQFLKQLRDQTVKRPRWAGELYLELHRGTYTSQARTKRYNRKLEFLLREVELFSAMALPYGHPYPVAALEEHWRTLLTNQFHDILPGSSIRKVYEDAEAQYAAMEAALTPLRNGAIAAMGAQFVADAEDQAYCAANPLAWRREEVVVVPGTEMNAAVDAEGSPLPAQPVEGGLALRVPLEAFGVSPIALRQKDVESASPFDYAGKTLETPHYRAAFDKAGALSSLYDKAAEREVVQESGGLNAFYTAEDLPIYWDAWDIDRDYRDRMTPEDRMIAREVVADGPLIFTLRSIYRIGAASELAQEMTFYADSRRIDFKTVVNWQETHRLLKAGFDIDVHADTWRNDIQFGHVVRNRHENTSWDQARFEVCAHKWVDVSEGDYGVALLNDCKYGHDTLDGRVSLTLLRGPVAPDEAADRGRQEFTYALLPHNGPFTAETVVREAYALNCPFTVLKATANGGEETALSLCSVDNPNVIVEAVKKAEADEALVVRLYEAGNTRAKAALRFARSIRKALACDLMEERDTAVTAKGDTIHFEIRPFEIKTFKVYLK